MDLRFSTRLQQVVDTVRAICRDHTSSPRRRRRSPVDCLPAVQRLEQRIVLHQPHDPMVSVAVSPDFENDGEVMVIDEWHTIHKSVDGGRNFYVVRDPLNIKPVTKVTYSPAYGSDQTVFAGTETEGVFRSRDGGESWTASSSGMSDLDVRTIAFSPNFAVDQTLFAGTLGGTVYRSVDGGDTWQQVYSNPAGAITDIEVSSNFAADQTLLVSQFNNGVQKSVNGGDSFSPVNNGLTSTGVLALTLPQNFASSQTVIAGTTGGVFVSFNGGDSWTVVNQGLDDLNIVDVEITPDNTAIAVAATGGVHIRTITDPAWTEINFGIHEFAQANDRHYYDLALSPTFGTDNKAFIATFGGLYQTHESGVPLWVESNVFSYRDSREVQVSPDFANDQTVFTAAYGGGLMKSTNAGDDWSVLSYGMSNAYPDDIAVSPDYATDQTVFSGNFVGVFKSTDGGASWSLTKLQPDLPGDINVRDVEVSPNFTVDQLVVATSSTDELINGVFLSTDAGETWTLSNDGLPEDPRVDGVEFSPNFAVDNTIFAALHDTGIYKSTDGGVTWSASNSGIEGSSVNRMRVSPAYAVDQTVFAVSAGRLVKSIDGGASWTILDTSVVPGVSAMTMSPDYATDQTVWIGSGTYGVYRSTDGGQTWNAGSTGLDRAFVNDMVASPDYAHDHTLFVAADQGTYRSTDGGDTFTYIQTLNRYEDEGDLMYFAGTWDTDNPGEVSGRTRHNSSTAGSTVEFEFYGNQIAWQGSKGPDYGRVRVTLDGQVIGVIDLYDPVAQQSTLIGQASLPEGWHTVVIEVLGTRNASSTGTKVSVDAFDVLGIPDVIQTV